MIITIDGPSGTGKSTTARLLAQKMQYNHLNSGAIYRALAWHFLKNGAEEEEEMKKVLDHFQFSIDKERFFVGDEEVTEEIRTEQISIMASKISKFPWVRKALLTIQKAQVEKGNLIAEGRDMGTVVFPHADLKIFLTANPEIRADRRFKELKEKGYHPEYDIVLEDLIQRDHTDSTRDASPLIPADDALIIDTSDLSIEEVMNEITNQIGEK